MSGNNETEDDVDIYSDLPNFQYDESIKKLETANKCLKEKFATLERNFEAIAKQNERLESINKALGTNISSLYKTATSEIKRKERMIDELRREKDKIIFRRTGKRNKYEEPHGQNQQDNRLEPSYGWHETSGKGTDYDAHWDGWEEQYDSRAVAHSDGFAEYEAWQSNCRSFSASPSVNNSPVTLFGARCHTKLSKNSSKSNTNVLSKVTTTTTTTTNTTTAATDSSATTETTTITSATAVTASNTTTIISASDINGGSATTSTPTVTTSTTNITPPTAVSASSNDVNVSLKNSNKSCAIHEMPSQSKLTCIQEKLMSVSKSVPFLSPLAKTPNIVPLLSPLASTPGTTPVSHPRNSRLGSNPSRVQSRCNDEGTEKCEKEISSKNSDSFIGSNYRRSKRPALSNLKLVNSLKSKYSRSQRERSKSRTPCRSPESPFKLSKSPTHSLKSPLSNNKSEKQPCSSNTKKQDSVQFHRKQENSRSKILDKEVHTESSEVVISSSSEAPSEVLEPSTEAAEHSLPLTILSTPCKDSTDLLDRVISPNSNLQTGTLKSTVKTPDNSIPLKVISPTYKDPAIIKDQKVSMCFFNEHCDFKRKKGSVRLKFCGKRIFLNETKTSPNSQNDLCKDETPAVSCEEMQRQGVKRSLDEPIEPKCKMLKVGQATRTSVMQDSERSSTDVEVVNNVQIIEPLIVSSEKHNDNEQQLAFRSKDRSEGMGNDGKNKGIDKNSNKIMKELEEGEIDDGADLTNDKKSKMPVNIKRKDDKIRKSPINIRKSHDRIPIGRSELNRMRENGRRDLGLQSIKYGPERRRSSDAWRSRVSLQSGSRSRGNSPIPRRLSSACERRSPSELFHGDRKMRRVSQQENVHARSRSNSLEDGSRFHRVRQEEKKTECRAKVSPISERVKESRKGRTRDERKQSSLETKEKDTSLTKRHPESKDRKDSHKSTVEHNKKEICKGRQIYSNESIPHDSIHAIRTAKLGDKGNVDVNVNQQSHSNSVEDKDSVSSSISVEDKYSVSSLMSVEEKDYVSSQESQVHGKETLQVEKSKDDKTDHTAICISRDNASSVLPDPNNSTVTSKDHTQINALQHKSSHSLPVLNVSENVGCKSSEKTESSAETCPSDVKTDSTLQTAHKESTACTRIVIRKRRSGQGVLQDSETRILASIKASECVSSELGSDNNVNVSVQSILPSVVKYSSDNAISLIRSINITDNAEGSASEECRKLNDQILNDLNITSGNKISNVNLRCKNGAPLTFKRLPKGSKKVEEVTYISPLCEDPVSASYIVHRRSGKYSDFDANSDSMAVKSTSERLIATPPDFRQKFATVFEQCSQESNDSTEDDDLLGSSSSSVSDCGSDVTWNPKSGQKKNYRKKKRKVRVGSHKNSTSK